MTNKARDVLRMALCVSAFFGCSGGAQDNSGEVATSQEPFSNQFGGTTDTGATCDAFSNGGPCASTHEEITTGGLPFLKTEVRNYIALTNARLDLADVLFNPSFHFDDCYFEETASRIRRNYERALRAALQFPTLTNCASPIVAGVPAGSRCTAVGNTSALDSFAAVLHPVQDFYSHTNWIENAEPTIAFSALGRFPDLSPFSPLSDLLVVENAGQRSPWHVFSNPLPSMLVTVRNPQLDLPRAGLPGLISGASPETTRGLRTMCPRYLGRGPAQITHDDLAKDSPTHPEFPRAFDLAKQQTTHEWCRFQSLVSQRYGTNGVNFLCDHWVDDMAAANDACPSLAMEARCPGPNVVPVAMCGATTVAAGDRLTFNLTVRNDGSVDAPAGAGNESDSWVGLYFLSSDPEITMGDLRVGGFTTQPAIPAGGSWSSSDGVDIPADTPAGTYYLGMILDPFGKLAETNESDNVLAYCAPVTVVGPSGGSLSGTIMDDFTFPADVCDVPQANSFLDLARDDGNGVLDAGDEDVAEVETDEAGHYEFVGLAEGDYWLFSETCDPIILVHVGQGQPVTRDFCCL